MNDLALIALLFGLPLAAFAVLYAAEAVWLRLRKGGRQ